MPSRGVVEAMREQTHHESLRHVGAHERNRTALVQECDEDAVAIGHTTYPADVSCGCRSAGGLVLWIQMCWYYTLWL